MAGYYTLVLYFHSPAAHEDTATPYCLLTHQVIYMYMHIHIHRKYKTQVFEERMQLMTKVHQVSKSTQLQN